LPGRYGIGAGRLDVADKGSIAHEG
jgi:hypothetical protein